ncbi:proton-coupled amino acid transporter-like protein CG1139 isoform X1 [Rhopalosiphum maidis]|uniref:proton-coupled amino acid transporter-like protein CG1139 isoform X1 n=2 Tax=Rhopalosiphum maidis TaxID=43146 RepID=UPI000F00F950|nr:proton-coupled amino acid transporter-like protein CG1139 isoform X1 [Rhopalosiphum maidis]
MTTEINGDFSINDNHIKVQAAKPGQTSNVNCDKMTIKTSRVNEDKPLLTGTATLYNQNGSNCLSPSPRTLPITNISSGPMSESLEKNGTDGGSTSDYNPLLNRQLENPTSNFDTMIHLLKGNIGTGILAMPDAFRNSGWVVGLVCTALLGAVCTHCMHILVRCSHELCVRTQRPSLSFPKVAEMAFEYGPPKLQKYSSAASKFINTFLVMTQLGFCCVYFLFVATNLQEVITHYFFIKLSVQSYLLILLVPMILLNCVKSLKYLTPASFLATILTVIGLGITFFYLLQGLPKTLNVKAFSSWQQLPLYFGTAVYAFEGIGMVLPLENNMKNPESFGGMTGVLNTGMVIVTCLYTSIGFFGYLRYGEAVKLGSITLNLPAEDLLAQSVRAAMAFSIFLSYGLQFYVPIGIVWPALKGYFHSQSSQRNAELSIRVFLVTLTFALAAAIPNLSAIISLVGSFSSSALALIFPPIIEIMTFWDHCSGKEFTLMFIKDIIIIIIGFLGFGFGSYASLWNIIEPISS